MSELDDTYGCLFLTVIFSTALWAASCLQLWFYIEKYLHTDKLWLKSYVIFLWILDTVYLVLVFKFLYIYFVREFGNFDYLDNLPKDIYRSAPFSPVIASMVQGLFVMRAWNLSDGNYFITGGLSFLVTAQFVITVVYIVKTRKFEHLEQLLSIVEYERAMNVITFITDTTIALVLMYLLWSRRSGFRRTEHLIKRLVAYTIGTGLVVGIMVTLAFIFAEVRPKSMAYVLIDFCTAKMYYNCMLASLNARRGLRERLRNTTAGISFNLDDLATTSSTAGSRTRPTVGSATLTSNSHREYIPRSIECRVDIDMGPEPSAKEHDRDDSGSELQEPTDKISSVV